MQLENIIYSIKKALENMNKNFCKLSKRDYNYIETPNAIIEYLKREKYLERPIAYEFYHQLRKLIEDGDIDFGEPIIQAEVNKSYQHLFENGKIPDFIIHLPNSNKNLAVIEFKLATSDKNDIKDDFMKLVKFKTHPRLRYDYGIEVLIGDMHSLENCRNEINKWSNNEGKEIILVEFDLDTWKAEYSIIMFKE